jgi:anti-anti-sigma factor
MNLTVDRSHGVSVVRVHETRLLYPLLAEFSHGITMLLSAGEQRVLLDLSNVTYVDSAAVGCLIDLSRQAGAAGARLKLTGVQKRVGTMLSMTGAESALEIHPDELAGIQSFD